MKQRKKKDGCQIIWVTVETCTAVITLFTTENLMHRSVMSSQPMACDLKLSYSLTGLNSRQKKARESLRMETKPAPIAIFHFILLQSSVIHYVCL